MGEELNVSIRREKLLSAMGIQVWYRRGVSAVQEAPVSVNTPLPSSTGETPPKVNLDSEPNTITKPSQPEIQASEQQQTIEFVWWRGQRGMLLLEPMQSIDEKLLHDLVIALDWRADGQVGKVANGHFRWPQLATSAGNPERAMEAFFDTNGPDGLSWLLVSETLISDIEALLPNVTELNTLPATLHLAEQKKALWQALAK